MHWLLLTGAIIFEVFATSMLKASNGFTRLAPSIAVVCGYVAAFYLLSLVVRTMPLGIAYAIWAAAGTLLVVGIGFVVYHEPLTWLKAVGILLTVAGVVILNLSGGHEAAAPAGSVNSADSAIS